MRKNRRQNHELSRSVVLTLLTLFMVCISTVRGRTDLCVGPLTNSTPPNNLSLVLESYWGSSNGNHGHDEDGNCFIVECELNNDAESESSSVSTRSISLSHSHSMNASCRFLLKTLCRQPSTLKSLLHSCCGRQHEKPKSTFALASSHSFWASCGRQDALTCLSNVRRLTVTTPMDKKPLLRFGVIADVQYADRDDRPAWYNPAKRRYYRNSLEQVRKAFDHWENYRQQPEIPVTFVLQLGDIIDALNAQGESHGAINRTLEGFLAKHHMPTFHTVGNHELYNFRRSEMSQLFDRYLFSRNDCRIDVEHYRVTEYCPLHYKFTPIPGVKFLSLDAYDISVLGYEETHPKYQEAKRILHMHHGVTDWEVWDTDKRLQGENRRFQSSNGAVGADQLAWLEAELEDSDRKNETVIVFGHVGLHPATCGWDSMLWNYDEVQKVFHRHTSVAAYFSGHAHNAGYAFDNDIHYVVFHGIIETDPKFDAFATLTLFKDSIFIDGRGVEENRVIKLRKPIKPPVGLAPEHIEVVSLESINPAKA